MLALLQEGLAGDGNSEFIASCTAGVMPADSAAVLSMNTDTNGSGMFLMDICQMHRCTICVQLVLRKARYACLILMKLLGMQGCLANVKTHQACTITR